MPAQEKLSRNEQILAYVAGIGIVIIIVALFLTALGTVDEDLATSMLLVGVVVVALAIVGWLLLLEPWRRFDDLSEPHYIGHDEQPHAEAMVAAAEPLGAEVAAPALETGVPVGEDLVAQAPVGAEAAPAVPVSQEAAAEVPAPVPMTVPDEAKPPAVLGETAIVVTDEAQPLPPAGVEGTLPGEAGAAAAAELASAAERDDLTRIDGIGPRSQAALYEAGITSFAQLAALAPDVLEQLMRDRKVRLVAGTATWPRQAELAANQDWAGLAELQSRIRGGALRDDL